MAFYQKYRPKNFSDLLGEDHISMTLREAVKTDRMSHAYLLCGPRGTGKTSTARLLAKALNCEDAQSKGNQGEPCNQCQSCTDIADGRSVDVIEIDAASHTKVDEIRAVIDKAQFAPSKSRMKVYIIDEVHMLSNSSFNALLKTLEEPPKHAVFILATTEVQKLPATILSRTQRYDFHRINKGDIVNNLKKVSASEGIKIEDDALEVIAIAAEGGHRDALGLLEQVASVTKDIKKSDVVNILGIANSEEVLSFLWAIFNKIPEEGLKIAHRLYEAGSNMVQFNRDVIETLRKIALLIVSDQVLFDDTQEKIDEMRKLAKGHNSQDLVRLLNIFVEAGKLLKDISYPLLPIEMAVIESCEKSIEAIDEKQETHKNSEKETRNKKQETSKQSKTQVVQGNAAAELIDISPDVSLKEDEVNKEAAEQSNNETVPVAVFQMTDDLWKKVIEITKKENPTLAALLRDAKPIEVAEGKIVLGVKFPFHKDKISESKNCSFLENVFGEIVGGKCKIVCKINDFKPKKVDNKTKDEDLHKAVEEVFN